MKTILNRKVLFLLLAVCIFSAAAVYAQMRPLNPSTNEMIQATQIQALRAEVMKLRVDLTVCHEELDRVKKQLDLCEKNGPDREAGPESAMPTDQTGEKKEDSKNK